MVKKFTKTKYEEGQWFAIPLSLNQYAIGIIVRGNYRTKGGFGYFWLANFQELPDVLNTEIYKLDNVIYITQFGDMGIINGEWPLLKADKPYNRSDWPLPQFSSQELIMKKVGYLYTYAQDTDEGFPRPIKVETAPWDEIKHLPREKVAGHKALVKVLQHLALGGELPD